ncbi:hypothetical protein UFOVP328_367 [uncultured Caudovirales phage]|uniref:Uncharacterized protein n=1 Tax=uncultured Caudovirales phage TaxID=2100421 RepID=A0A6J5LUA2_9CAUD|nr:hypothetical protein UFOVP328_367 [uncultured Caudovirales phage]
MATKAEKQQLIDTLKFTPRTYRISMWGYGGEKVMGTVDPKAWDYCLKHRVDLVDMAWGDYDEIVEEQGLDPDMLPFTPGSWYECDSMAHVSGVSRSSGTLQIEDETGKTIYEKHFDDITGGGCDGEPDWCCNDEVWIGQRKKGEVVFVGSSNEKGTFFEGKIELKAPFNIEKLELHYDEVDGEEIINSVYYDGEEIENWGGSTDGKSSDMDMVRVIDDNGNWERYAVPDEDEQPHETGTDNPIDFPESACTSEEWDPAEELQKIELPTTDWFPKDIKPVHKGEYECEFVIVTWPWPAVRMCEWTGRTWKETSTGDKVKGEFRWRGLTQEHVHD